MTNMKKHNSNQLWPALVLAGAMSVLLAGCGGMGAQATPLPTRTPLPTFTPTSEVAAAPPTVAIEQQPAQATQDQAQPAAPAEGDQQAATPAQDQQAAAPAGTPAPEATPTPQSAQLVLNDIVNIRSGPGTTYGLLGSEQQGATYPITGKSPDGAWWQINYKGSAGWVFGQLVAVTGGEGVVVAQNIPPAPTAAPAPPPTNTPQPAPEQPTQPPAPVEPPKPQYKFNVAVVGACLPQESGNWFYGQTYINGQPQNGYKVVFSYAPDGGWVTEPMLTGPHPGYPGWDTGYYSHIIRAAGQGAEAGSWYAWIVDDGGQRISEIASWQFDGKGSNTCNEVIVSFDSR